MNMHSQAVTTLIEAALALLSRVGHLKRYQAEVKALQEAIAQVPSTTPAIIDVDRPAYTTLRPARVPSETFLEKVARLEQEALEKQTK